MKRRKILVTGVYDVLTRAHVELLQWADALGDVCVGINDDASVRLLKGPTRPVNSELDRLFVLESLKWVKWGFIIRSTKVTDAIIAERPYYWVKGGTYTMESLDKEEVAAARKVGAEIVLFPERPGYSTTETLKRLEAK